MSRKKKCPTSGDPQYSLWLHSEAFLSWICDLLSESFNFFEQKALWEQKAWGWGTTLESVSPGPHPFGCFLPVREQSLNSSDLSQELIEERTMEES